jgi:hypothetical protein
MLQPVRGPRSPGAHRRIGVLIAAALAWWLGITGAAHAPPPNPEAVGDPASDRVWAGCVLSGTTIDDIETAIGLGSNIGVADFTFGVVYARTKPNSGQPRTTTSGGGFTGPVVCIPQSGLGVAIEKTDQEENIPTAEDQGTGVSKIDLLDIGQALVERYRYGTTPTFENRFCHTVSNPGESEPPFTPPETNTDCFRIFPTSSPSQSVDPPTRDRVWGGCSLLPSTVNAIRTALQAGRNIDSANIEFSHLVVYSNNNTNNGQPLTTGGTTGPVICRAPDVGIKKTTESQDIPNSTDQPGVTAVDLLDTSEALVLRYGYPVGQLSQTLETRFCHTVANSDTTGALTSPPPETNTDCFRVYPSP